MKKILYFVIFLMTVSCVVKKSPSPDPPPIPPDPNVLSYMFDAKDQYIGAVLEINGIYYKVRSSKGYWAVVANCLTFPSKGIYFSTQSVGMESDVYLFNPQKSSDTFNPDLVRLSNDLEHANKYYTRTRIAGDSASKNELTTVRYFFGTQGKSEETINVGGYVDMSSSDHHVDENTWNTAFVGVDIVSIPLENPIKVYSTTNADEAFETTGFPKAIDESAPPQLLSFDEASIKEGFPESERHWQGWTD